LDAASPAPPNDAIAVDVVLPALDEVEGVRWLLPRLPSGHRAIVVDNGSTDGTAEAAEAGGALVVREPTKGFGAACFAGLSAATAPVVAFMDADASFDPADLPKVTQPVLEGRADLVLGARTPEGRSAWPLHARVANRFLAWELRRRADVDLTDLGPMRAARRRDLLALGIADRRSGWPLEMVLLAAEAGWDIEEVAVRYLARAGRSKVTGTIRGTMTAVSDMSRVLARG
jgi:glycosyltransferase involved in cell wall biosynthesis